MRSGIVIDTREREVRTVTEATPKTTPEQALAVFESKKQLVTQAVQAHLDTTAQARGYDSIFTCISYVSSTDPTFNAEAVAAVAWRDEVWIYCHGVLAEVVTSARLEPTLEELLAELPAVNW